jgi:hexosaminidase
MSRSREFIGYNGNDAQVVIDLGNAQQIDSVTVHTLNAGGSWIYPAQKIEVSLSKDGKSFQPAGSSTEFIKTNGGNGKLQVTFSPVSARFVKVDVENLGKIPDGKPGAGEKAWLFLDEVVIQ